jgi:Bacterial regulatory protein, arsR family
VCEPVPLFDLSQPTVSHHLKVLRQAGIVGSEREGLWALLTHRNRFRDLAVPGASTTMALGVNDRDELVGVYQVDTGSSAVMHGFAWTAATGFQTVDDPNGIGTTTVNGVNDRGQLVGFYVDAAGNTDGLLATPAPHHHRS